MLVAHRDDYDTHAVVGGKEIMAFGVAETAEFFTVLSDTLYSNKPLAVVREVVCNAWDSHIASGRTEMAVEVTVTEDKLVIRDFGNGIAPTMMHPIYCIYGASTKENDGKQTGGFGLGSKAPFAYSDHFTVTSHHAGTKTVYAISRGSALTKGRPDCRVMVRVPTTETGLEVSIPLKSPFDQGTFQSLVQQVAFQGGMKIRLNGKPMSTLPLDQAVNNVFLTKRAFPFNESILVRYGNVLYPVPTHADYVEERQKIQRLLGDLSDYHSKWKAILQAPGHSISVTPSRESLSLTETTTKTLKKLLANLAKELSQESPAFATELHRLDDEVVDSCYRNIKPQELLQYGNLFRTYAGDFEKQDITRVEELVGYICRARVDNLFGKFVDKDKLRRRHINILIANRHHRFYDLQKFLKLPSHDGKAFAKQFLRPLIKRVSQHPMLKLKNLYVRTNHWNKPFVDIDRYQHPDQHQHLSLLAGVVVVTYSKQALNDDYSLYDKGGYPLGEARVVYVASRAKGHRAEAVSFFRKLGYHVVDFASKMDKLEPREKKPRAPKEKKPAGLPTLSNLITKFSTFSGNRHLKLIREGSEVVRNDQPVCVFKPYHLSADQFFVFGDHKSYHGRTSGKAVVELVGPVSVISTSQPQHDKLVAGGIQDGYVYLAELISKEILTNKLLQDYLIMFDQLGGKSFEQLNDIYRLAKHCPRLLTELQLPNVLGDREQNIIAVFKTMWAYLKNGHTPEWEKPIHEVMRQQQVVWATSPAVNHFVKTMRVKSNLLATFNLDDMVELLDTAPTPKPKAFFEEIILKAFKL